MNPSSITAGTHGTLRAIKLVVAYDGTNYLGWQSQRNDRTIQEVLEKIGSQIAGEKVQMHASGRTDAGVHALGQVVSFQTHARHSPAVWKRAFNGFLPPDIGVLEVEEIPRRFHARKDAIGKRYRYLLSDDGQIPEVLAQNAIWQVLRPLDLTAMQAAAAKLVGTHDFYSFRSGGSRRLTTIRTITEICLWRPWALPLQYWSVNNRDGVKLRPAKQDLQLPTGYPHLLRPDRLIVLEVASDGFLYNMVRTIMGTLVQVGTKRREQSWPVDVLAARDRRQAGQTAPARGLYLVSVQYPVQQPKLEASATAQLATHEMNNTLRLANAPRHPIE